MSRITVPSVASMDDETFMKHMELRHGDDLKLTFKPEPARAERRLRNPVEWRTYHEAMHRLYRGKYDHDHAEA